MSPEQMQIIEDLDQRIQNSITQFHKDFLLEVRQEVKRLNKEQSRGLTNLVKKLISESLQAKDSHYKNWSRHLAKLKSEFKKILHLRKSLFSENVDRLSISQKAYQDLKQRISLGDLTDLNEARRFVYELNSQSFGSFCEKFERIVVMSREKNSKNIQDLKIENADKLIHRNLMKAFDDSLVHLVRNAVDHGIEPNEQREKQKKGPGLIQLSYENNSKRAMISLSDDGGGIDKDLLVEKAVDKGLISDEDALNLSDEQQINLIFLPGLSIKTVATQTSGRGVGMDAVKNYIERLGGTVNVSSKLGAGTTFTLTVPVNI